MKSSLVPMLPGSVKSMRFDGGGGGCLYGWLRVIGPALAPGEIGAI